MSSNTATESTSAQGMSEYETLLILDQKCKSHLSHLSDINPIYPGSGPTGGQELTGIIIPGRDKPGLKGGRKALKPL